jgi:hypothetical protein
VFHRARDHVVGDERHLVAGLGDRSRLAAVAG